MEFMEKATVYFKKHPAYNSTVHALGGIGIGIIIASPVAGIHPVRIGVTFLILSFLGHLYALSAK